MKCVSCRKPTTYIIDVDRVIKCKLCKRKAQPTIKVNRCRHKFNTPEGFSNFCKKCGVEIDLRLLQRMIPPVQQQPVVPQQAFNDAMAIGDAETLNITGTIQEEPKIDTTVKDGTIKIFPDVDVDFKVT